MDVFRKAEATESGRPVSVLLAGATGLVGGQVLHSILGQSAERFQVIAPTRRSLNMDAPNLINPQIENSSQSLKRLEVDLLRMLGKSGCDVFVCALGSTIKKAGGQMAFVSVDRDLVLALASTARKLGAKRAILVSSVGANPRSHNFYLRVKGEVERGLAELGFPRVDLVRPGLLLGDRGEVRPGERIAAQIAPIYNPLLVGPLKRYRAIEARTVARAMVALAKKEKPGWFVHEFERLKSLAETESAVSGQSV